VIDLRRLRDEPEYRAGVERKRVKAGLIDDVLAADARRRDAQTRAEELRARQNTASKEIGKATPDERPAKIEAAGALKEQVAAVEAELTGLDAGVRELALQLPNPADPSSPDGGEEESVAVRVVGGTPAPPPLDHAAFGEAMRWVETDQAVHMSGSRFAYLMREAVLLELALVQWVTRTLVEQDFTPVVPPVLVREHAMEQAGFFPTDRNQVYEVDGGELFLVGTAEVPLSALHRDEILPADTLPRRYLGISSCFRREAGTYGKDTRGIFRVHQFDKVEMFSFVEPERSAEEHEHLLALEEAMLQELGLPYRVVNIPVGDLGASAAKKYDCEAWLPGQGRYRELTSCSNTTDYQARRLACRYRPEGGGSPRPVHTLNGTACAVGRTIIALMENGQREDGSVALPEVLQEYGAPEALGP
jgi:seryl-tRNA synthetase